MGTRKRSVESHACSFLAATAALEAQTLTTYAGIRVFMKRPDWARKIAGFVTTPHTRRERLLLAELELISPFRDPKAQFKAEYQCSPFPKESKPQKETHT